MFGHIDMPICIKRGGEFTLDWKIMTLSCSLVCTKGRCHSLAGQLTLSVPLFRTRPPHFSSVTAQGQSKTMAYTLLLCIRMSLYCANAHYYLYCICWCPCHILFSFLPLADFVSSVLVPCTLANLLPECQSLSSVHVCTTHFTLNEQPIRSLHSLPISLMMRARHTDPRLNPCDLCILWLTTISL